MKVKQIYTGCLAEAAYYIGSNGEAAIIDPLRETQQYIDLSNQENTKIKYVFLTHFHADFVSGHLDLARKTGATIVYGPTAKEKTGYEIHEGADNEVFNIGDVTLTLLHTPGHTMESSSYLLKDEQGIINSVFSGDTLFLGDVGRPDLAVKSDLTKEQLAGHSFDSLRAKIMTLPNETIVYPNHGAGSACGKNMSKETIGTIGHEKKTNYALREDMTKEDFVNELLDGILPPPAYFSKNAMLNIKGSQSFDDVLEKGNVPLNANIFLERARSGALVLDVRNPEDFAKAHIPGSIFIGLNGSFAPWVGALIPDIRQEIILVTPLGDEEETITRLSRVGYDNTLGFLDGGFDTWLKSDMEIDAVDSISAEEFVECQNRSEIPVFDVRKKSENLSEHVIGVRNTPLDNINDFITSYPEDTNFFIHCAGGYRSMIASSILKSRGIHNLIDVKGGFAAIKEAGAEVSTYRCPSTL